MNTAVRYAPLGYEQVTGLSAVKGLTVPKGATVAVITVSGQSVRYRDDGTDPTTTTGVDLPVSSQPFEYSGGLSSLRFIETAASATLDVLYYKNAG